MVITEHQSAVKCVRNEISCLLELQAHQNIIGFVHAKEFANYIILAIEYAAGGTL